MKDYDKDIIVPLADNDEADSSCSDEVRRCENVQENEKISTVIEGIYDEKKDEEDDYDEVPGWDGSESEVVADDDAAVYEEEQTGIKIEYALRKEEIVSCLKHCGAYKSISKYSSIQISILAVFSVVFFASYFSNPIFINLLLGFLSIAAMLIICIAPMISIYSKAKKMSEKSSVYIEVYPDSLVIGQKGKESEIPLDGTSMYEEYKNMILIYPPNGGLLVIPLRSIEPDFMADMQAMIVAGTAPMDDE